MSYLVANQIALSCAPEGPLAVYLGPFAESLRREGYSQGSIRRKLMLAACFSRWLEQNEVALRCITSGHLTRFLRCRARDCQVIRGDRASLGGLRARICALPQRHRSTHTSSATRLVALPSEAGSALPVL